MKTIIGKDGFPTAYGFACGYTKTSTNSDTRVQTYLEHGVYHVSAYDFNEHVSIGREAFTSIQRAKECHRDMCKSLRFHA